MSWAISQSGSLSSARSPGEGPGGRRTHTPQPWSLLSSGSLSWTMETGALDNGKVTMQNLNDRMSLYLDKVRALEAANTKQELQIREFNEQRASTVCRDFTKYFSTINDLKAQILQRCRENQAINVQIENTQLATDDFKIRYETELNIRNSVEVDMASLRRMKDNLDLTISDLNMQVEGLKEELVNMKSSHKEEIHLVTQRSGDISVEVDTMGSVDMLKTLEEMREHYESMVAKNRSEVKTWYTAQVETLQKQISTATTEVKTFNIELVELKRRLQEYEITRQSLVTTIQCLRQNLEEVNHRFGSQLSQMQVTITALETELQQLRLSIEKQQCEYDLLLDIKMRLELEIAEYRRLLDGEYQEICIEEKEVEIVTKVPERIPQIKRRVKIIIEELIDGQVVSKSVETKEEDIQ